MKKIILIILFSLIIVPSVLAQYFDVSDTVTQKQYFDRILRQSVERLQVASVKRSIQLKKVNQSIANTVSAAQYFFNDENLELAKEDIEKAQSQYDDNVVAHLLASEIYQRLGDEELANEARLSFLKRSSKMPWIARDVFNSESRKFVYDYVASYLREYGYEVPKARGINQVPLIQQLSLREGSILTEMISLGLPMIVCIGLVFFMWRSMTGSDIWFGFWNKILIQSYIVFVFTYIIWIAHLFLQVPIFFKPVEYEILIVLLGGISIIVVEKLVRKTIERKRILSDPALRACPHCREIIPKLDLICSSCGKKIED